MYRKSLLLIAALALLMFGARSGLGQTAAPGQAAGPQANGRPAPDPPHERGNGMVWRLAPADQMYAAIDPERLLQYVKDQTAISRRYRDAGHQFWGRIIGTEADTENAQWMMDKFHQFGLADVHEQMFDLPPQWMPQSWNVTVDGDGKTFSVGTAQPTYQGVATPSGGMDLEAAYVAQGSDADFALAHDVKGKAVFILTEDLNSRHINTSNFAIKRAEDHGAAAIFVILAIPNSNIKTQFYPVNSKVPTFTTGFRDGITVRDMIGAAAAANTPAPRVKLNLDVKMAPDLKSGTVWGTLPGATDELVYVIAHRDGWFEGANDDGAGVATLVGLAEYFSKIPKAQRKRTIMFLGTTGHHNSGGQSGVWLGEHKEIFAKAALVFNCEHTGPADTEPNTTNMTNGAVPITWYVGGSNRLREIAIKAMDAMGVASNSESTGAGGGEMGRYYWYAPGVMFLSNGQLWHSDHETAEVVSPSGLAAVTRAYAKIITDTGALSLKDLQRPSGQEQGAN